MFLTRKCLQLITCYEYKLDMATILVIFSEDSDQMGACVNGDYNCVRKITSTILMMRMKAMARFWVGLTPTVAPVVHLLSPITLNRRPTLALLCWYTPPLLVHPCLLYVCTYQSVIQLPLLSSTAPNRTTFTSAPPLAPLVFAMKYVCQVLVISHWAALTLLAHPAGGHDATMLMMTVLLMIPMMMTVMCWSWWRRW